jgi:predicted cupin superfamily sugar epimerase
MKHTTGLSYIVTGLLLVGCGTVEERAPFYGVSREDALQISRILREEKHVQKIQQYYRQEDGTILVLTRRFDAGARSAGFVLDYGSIGCRQAARPLGEYSFLGCTVAPGFEFEDFKMLSDGSAALAHITSLNATLAELA